MMMVQLVSLDRGMAVAVGTAVRFAVVLAVAAAGAAFATRDRHAQNRPRIDRRAV